MAISLQYLIDQTRLISGLRNNRLFDDDQITTLLTDAYADLRDKLIIRFAYWFRKTYPEDEQDTFSLENGEGLNFLDLTLIPDLEMVQGLDLVDSSGNHFTVPMLPSFTNRNSYNGVWPWMGGAWSFNGFMGRSYFPDGDKLFVLPAANAAGDYQLIYTPQAEMFGPESDQEWPIDPFSALTHNRIIPFTQGDHVDGTSRTWTFREGSFTDTPVGAILNVTTGLQTGPFTVEAVVNDRQIITFETPLTESFTQSDSFLIDDSMIYSLPGTEFTDEMEGGEVTLTFDAPNDTLNGMFEIFEVMSATQIVIRLYSPASAITLPAAGTVSVVWQPAGTISVLPPPLVPWNKYLILHASLAIRASRRQPAADLQLQFGQISQRVVALTKQRTEGVRQAPINRGFGGWGRGGFGV